jgi:hypothetical protein
VPRPGDPRRTRPGLVLPGPRSDLPRHRTRLLRARYRSEAQPDPVAAEFLHRIDRQPGPASPHSHDQPGHRRVRLVAVPPGDNVRHLTDLLVGLVEHRLADQPGQAHQLAADMPQRGQALDALLITGPLRRHRGAEGRTAMISPWASAVLNLFTYEHGDCRGPSPLVSVRECLVVAALCRPAAGERSLTSPRCRQVSPSSLTACHEPCHLPDPSTIKQQGTCRVYRATAP